MEDTETRFQRLENQVADASARIKQLETWLAKSEAEGDKLKKAQLKLKKDLLELSDTTPWRRTKASSQQDTIVVEEADYPEGIQDLSFKLPFDVYSVLAFNSCAATLPFFFSLTVIVGLQITLLVLLLVDQLQTSDDADNWLGVPSNVETTVRASQALSLIIALFSQDDLRVGIEGIFQGAPTMFKGNMCFNGMNSVQWGFAYILRFLQGFLGLCASFVLLVKAETVFDVLLNFLGVQFVSTLDDLAFRLGMLGYFGKSVRETTNNVAKASFFRDEGKGSSCVKAFAHVIGLFAVLVAMATVFAFLAIQQDGGEYSVSHVRVTFGDEVLPYLGIFNGCYEAKEGDPFNRRLVYEQVGFDGSGGKFVFCDEIETDDDPSEGWVFSNTAGEEACRDYFVRSGGTKTFDIVQVGEMREWYTKDGLLLDSAQILNVQQPGVECGSRVFEESKSACQELFVDGSFGSLVRAPSFRKLQVGEVEIDKLNDMTLSHPIYYNTSTSELVLFTGRRWIVIANQDRSSTTDSEWLAYFYGDYEFQGPKRNPSLKAWEAVEAISEIVETSAGTSSVPVGLQWYSARHSNSTFPFPDLTRPQDGTFGCSFCNNVTNPCFFGGICQDDGSCECADRTSGDLCRDPPLSDGVCDDRFNDALYKYDGGDCCGGTCVGLRCGGTKSSLFGYDAVYLASVPHAGDTGGVRQTTFSGFDKCIDPDMASYRFQIGPFDCGAVIPDVTVMCGGVMYLIIPSVDFRNVFDYADCVSERIISETIRLPFGIVCDVKVGSGVGFSNSELYSIYYESGANDSSLLVSSGDYDDGDTFSWALPSRCMIEALSDLVDFQDMINTTSKQGQALISLSRDNISDELCREDKEVLVERYALMFLSASLKDSLGSTSEDHCDWFGISCVGGRVEGWGRYGDVDLKDGEIPTEFGLLTNLKHIFCEQCGASMLPTEIGLLTQLTYLSFRENRISSIPSEIGNLAKLVRLDLYDNFFNILPSEIANLKELRDLNLQSWWDDAKVPKSVFGLSVSALSLGDRSLDGPLPTEIGLMTNLLHLNMEGRNVTGSIPSEIGLMTSLKAISLHSTRNYGSNSLTGTIPSSIQNLLNLKDLSLGGNNLSGSVPVLPTNLETCTLFANSFGNIDNAVAAGCDFTIPSWWTPPT